MGLPKHLPVQQLTTNRVAACILSYREKQVSAKIAISRIPLEFT
jgi:hypothetical protein